VCVLHTTTTYQPCAVRIVSNIWRSSLLDGIGSHLGLRLFLLRWVVGGHVLVSTDGYVLAAAAVGSVTLFNPCLQKDEVFRHRSLKALHNRRHLGPMDLQLSGEPLQRLVDSFLL
jgi:hypothetical protein